MGETMTTEEYLGIMRPWYGLEKGVHDQAQILQAPEIEGVEQFEFSPVQTSSYDQNDPYNISLSKLDLVQASHEKQLVGALLARLHCLTHSCFEGLVLDVVRAAGFASDRPDLAHKVGRSGDGGIDGIIDLDDFGLDAIYLQAKRLRPGTVVGAPAVRDFIGSLEMRHASKGVFVTTGQFSQPAMDVVKGITRRITLVDGERFAGLMIRHGIGLRKVKAFQFHEIDDLWFEHAERGHLKSC